MTWSRGTDTSSHPRGYEIVSESDRVQVFVGYDPGNYFLEFDTFVEAPGNEELRAQLAAVRVAE